MGSSPDASPTRGLAPLAAAIGSGGAALIWWWWHPGYPLPEDRSVGVLAGVALLTLAAMIWRDARASRWPRRAAGWPLLAGALLAAMAWTNFGSFHGQGIVHHWEQFHHVLGAKYFPELGYDGLYVASITAEATARPGRPTQPWTRDLRDDTVVAVDSERFDQHRLEVTARFTPPRRAEFARDNLVFVETNTANYLQATRGDHGLNATPTWIGLARLFTAVIPIDPDGLRWYAILDLILLVGSLGYWWRTFGPRLGALAVILVGTSYFGRFWWIGGAFLREDWFACCIVAICLLQQRRFRGAGGAFALAAALRVFPVLLLIGPVVSLVARRQWLALRQLAVGAALVGAGALVVGSLAGRGPGVWLEFGEEIGRHSQTWLTNNVGFANTVLYDGVDFRREMVDFELPEPWIHWQARMDQRLAQRLLPIWAGRLVLLGLLIAAARRVSPAAAAALSASAVFALTFSTCYYWQMLALLVVLESSLVIYGVAGIGLLAFVLHFASPSFEFRYGMLSWALLAGFVALLLGVWRGWLQAPAALADDDSANQPRRTAKQRNRTPSRQRRGRGRASADRR